MTCAPAATCARTNAIADLDEALEQVAQPLRPVVDVEEDVRVAAQDRRERERPLDPSHHRHVVAHARAQQADGVEPVAHPPAVLGCDDPQAGRVLRRLEQDRPADRQAVLRPLDVEAEVRGLPVRVGDGLDDIEIERLEHGEVRLHERAVVEVVVAQPAAGVVRRPLHVDVEVGPPVDRLAAEPPTHPLEGLHAAEDTPVDGGPRGYRRANTAAQSTRAVSCIRAKSVSTAPTVTVRPV